jgi:glucuronoarabinoxylan endo-1,4-beta-xylanase
MGTKWLSCVIFASGLAAVSCNSNTENGAPAGSGGTTGSGGSSTSQNGGSGGGSAVTGGNGSSTGGSTASSGGSTGTSGGMSGKTGGTSSTTGGIPGTTGGIPGTTGGIPGTTGGIPGTTGGIPGTTGGISGTTGGTKTGGSTGTTGGSSVGGSATGGAATGGSNSNAVTVQLGQAKQVMAGFGINNNWAPAMTDAVADALFDTTKGIGLSILRIGMNESGNPTNGTSCWEDIKKAKARGVTTFIGSLWSPPANCKTNNNINDGGHLLTNCYDSWSTTIAAFAAKVKSGAGVDLYAMSPQNEPDFASCGNTEPCSGNYSTTLFTANEMVAFVKVVGPKLHALNPPVKVLAPEASEWIHLWSNTSACCSEPSGKNSSDPLKCGFPATSTTCASGGGYDYGHYLYKDSTAWAQLDLIGVHQYDTLHAEPWPADVPDKKPVWQTEMSGVKWWPEQGPSSDINNGVVVAGWIHDALTVGEASAWLWWVYSGSVVNTGLVFSDGTDTKRHYTLGNFSKFIRPNYTRVDITGSVPTDVLLTAFKGTDGTVVVVAINKGTASVTVPISIAGGTAPASLVPWVTSASDNLASKTAVSVNGGSFTATLASKTVTTFVGK